MEKPKITDVVLERWQCGRRCEIHFEIQTVHQFTPICTKVVADSAYTNVAGVICSIFTALRKMKAESITLQRPQAFA